MRIWPLESFLAAWNPPDPWEYDVGGLHEQHLLPGPDASGHSQVEMFSSAARLQCGLPCFGFETKPPCQLPES